MSPWFVTLAATVMRISTSVETYFTGWVGSAAGEGRGGFLLLKRFQVENPVNCFCNKFYLVRLGCGSVRC